MAGRAKAESAFGDASAARPSISVVIPHLNQEDSLRVCLEANTQQANDVRLSGVVVADNGSRRSPVAVCEPFAFVSLVTEPEPGPGPARNRGVDHCNGDVVAFIDADCIAAPGWLRAIEHAFLADPRRQILGGDVRIPPRDGPLTQVEAYETIFAYRMDKYIAKQGFTGTGNLAVRREVLRRVGPFCGIERAEDRDWGQRATGLGYRIHFTPDMVAYHPARNSFDELVDKWRRHIAHDHAGVPGSRRGALRWMLRAAAVAVSPAIAAPEVIVSPRLRSPGSRMAALACLARIRLFRAREMMRLAVTRPGWSAARAWNRPAS